MTKPWRVDSWKEHHANQQPTYADASALGEVLAALKLLPPLVTSWEVDNLKSLIGRAQDGYAWLLQGGDCAESFEDCQAEPIASKLKVLLQMSLVLVYSSRQRIIRVGRIAGQYAKPRSSDIEQRGEVVLPTYRGDLINRRGFSEAHRRADPQLLLRGYERSALTLNFIRGLSQGGFADLHHPENWKLLFTSDSAESTRYRQLVQALGEAIRFIEAISDGSLEELRRVDFFTSHEALHLHYEQALTRESVRGCGWYNLGTHMPWLGDRTRALDGAHIEYLRGIRNPIGVKVGPSMAADELCEVARVLNPTNEPGRLTLIHRLGANQITAKLPPLIQAIQEARANVLWICDPMHGNTRATAGGHKTRQFEDVLAELRDSIAIHQSLGSLLGGVHLELTGEAVTECIGGASGLTEDDLHTAYQTHCDPRLNYEQAMEIAFSIADLIRKK